VFQQTRRPWVAIDTTGDKGIVPHDALTSDESFVYFPLRYSLKNFGQSPANVQVDATILSINYAQDAELVHEVDKFCEHPINDEVAPQYDWPAAIVPGTMIYNHTLQLPIKPEMQKEGIIKPTIVGCVWYRATTGDTKTLHKTPFSGQVSRAVDESGATVEAPNIVAIPFPRTAFPKRTG
jgi:hypothetical protein